jgi:hypothetical protein
LGGIYALQQIANNSPPDRASTTDVLNTFVRRHAPWPPRRPGQYVEDAPIEDIPLLSTRAPDVQAALTVLVRRKRSIGSVRVLNLADTDLRRADFSGTLLIRGLFLLPVDSGVHLDAQWKKLRDGAQLQGAFLSGAQLQSAILVAAQLQEATLGQAQLQGAILVNAQLQNAILNEADIRTARLDDAQLQGARLDGAQLQGAHLFGAQLQGAYLDRAQLKGAYCDAETNWPVGFDWKAAGVERPPFAQGIVWRRYRHPFRRFLESIGIRRRSRSVRSDEIE